MRPQLANEWGVGKITCVPLETGVLEFGTVTKDKRETTVGSEFSEANREYRRSVFMHGEWVDHRSTERFYKTMKSLTASGVLRARYNEIANVVAISTFLVIYNTLSAGYTDFDNVKHAAIIGHLPVLSMPLSVFSLTAPSLGLLLVFRTNAAYGRWDNARKVRRARAPSAAPTPRRSWQLTIAWPRSYHDSAAGLGRHHQQVPLGRAPGQHLLH